MFPESFGVDLLSIVICSKYQARRNIPNIQLCKCNKKCHAISIFISQWYLIGDALNFKSINSHAPCAYNFQFKQQASTRIEAM